MKRTVEISRHKMGTDFVFVNVCSDDDSIWVELYMYIKGHGTTKELSPTVAAEIGAGLIRASEHSTKASKIDNLYTKLMDLQRELNKAVQELANLRNG